MNRRTYVVLLLCGISSTLIYPRISRCHVFNYLCFRLLWSSLLGYVCFLTVGHQRRRNTTTVNLEKYCKGLTFNIQDVVVLADPVEENVVTSEHTAGSLHGLIANTHPKIAEFFKNIQSNLDAKAAKEAVEISIRSNDEAAEKSDDKSKNYALSNFVVLIRIYET
jgi:hypothetical protein